MRAFACDAVSAFGGIVAFHGACDEAAAEAMREVFTEVVIAPAFTDGRAAPRSPNGEPPRGAGAAAHPAAGTCARCPGGALVQDLDVVRETRADWKVVSQPRADARRSGATWSSRGRSRGG